MYVLCKYYTSPTRLIAGMKNFSTLKNFHFHALDGILVWNKGTFKISSPKVTALMMGKSPSTGKTMMAVVTNDAAYAEHDGKPVALDLFHCEVPLFSLCNMLREKYSTTDNYFELHLQGEGKVVKLSMDEDMPGMFKCIVCTSSGDCIVTGDDNLRKVLSDCAVITSFHYRATGPDVEKEVIIRRGYGEILKEISRYLNRTLILTSLSEDDVLSDVCASPHSIMEISYSGDGEVTGRRLAPCDVKYSKVLCISFTTQGIEDLSRSRLS